VSEIDRLEIKVQAQAASANQQLDKLVSKLESMKSSLNGINGSGLTGLSNGISKFSNAAQGLNNVKTSDFTRLVKNIEKISGINTQQMNATASAINTMVGAFNRVGTVSQNTMNVAEMAKSISKLGGKNVQTAITNMPQLANSLKNLMAVLSTAPKVSTNIINMTNSLANLASQGRKVGTASNTITNGFRRYSNGARTAETRTKSLASAIGLLYAKFYLLIRAVKLLGTAIKSSMDYIEEYNYFNVTMGKIASEWSQDFGKYGYTNAEAYASSFQTRLSSLLGKMSGFNLNTDGTLSEIRSMSNLGLDVTSLVNYAAGLAQVTNSLGLTGEASVITSKALTMLAGDMSSFRNIDLSEVMTNFKSGIIGQSRALYKYGIDITNATLATYAYNLGIKKNVSEMTQAEKMQLRMLAILDQSKVAWGDLANTINSPSNQLRLLKNNFVALGRTIGNLFLPMVAKVLPYINALVIAIRRLFEWVGSLLGIDLSKIISSSSAGYSDGFEDIEDGADSATDAIDGATDSANKLKKTVSGLDELNILNDNSTSKSGGSGVTTDSSGALDMTGALNTALSDYETAWNKAFDGMENNATKFADAIAKKFEPVKVALEGLWNDGFAKFADFSFGALSDFYDDFLTPLGDWAIGEGLPRLIKVLNNLLNKVKWKEIRTSLKDFWTAIEPYAENFGEGLIDFFEDVGDLAVGGINLLLGKDGWLSKLTDTLDKGDPENARQWGYSLAILFGAFTGLKIATSTLTALTAIQAFITKVAPFAATLGGFAITITLVGTALAWANALNLMDRYENGTPTERAEIRSTWNKNKQSSGRYQQMKKSSDWWTNYKDNSPSREHMIGSSKEWDESFDKLKSTVEKWPDKISKWFGNKKLEVGTKLTTLKTDVSNWWTGKVQPWWGEKKLSVKNKFDTLKSDVSTWWSGVEKWWGNAKLSVKNSFDTTKENTVTWWGNVKTWWGERNLSVKSVFNTTESTVKGWARDIKTWWSKNIPDLSEIGKSMIDSLIKGFKSISLPKLKIDTEPVTKSIFGKEVTMNLPKLSFYANGGFPGVGEMFVARESGPELVGTMGGRTAVANNSQIESGIEEAAYRGMTRAIRENGGGNSSGDIYLENAMYMDDGVLLKSVQRAQQKANRKYQSVTKIP